MKQTCGECVHYKVCNMVICAKRFPIDGTCYWSIFEEDLNHFQSKIDMDAVKEEVKEIDGHAEMIFDNRQNEHIVNLHSQKLIRKFNNLKKLLGIGGI